MRVVILTQWYPPEPAVLMKELAESLCARGHAVTVVTGFPNYPSGTIYDGYRVRPWQRERHDAVEVVRVALYPEHSRSGVKRALNYASFAASASVLAPWLVERPNVLFVYHPPLTVGVPGAWLSALWRAPMVYQIQDMWPETLVATGMLSSPTMLRGVARMARWVYARAAAICVISEGFRANLIAKGVPASKVHVISNWVDPAVYRPLPPDQALAARLGISRRFNVLFAGNVGEAQELGVVIEAAQLLSDQPDAQFVIVGDGVALPRLRQEAERRGVTNVRFLGRLAPDAMPSVYALADVLLLHLKDDPLFRITIPHKIFTYLASGKPILAAVAGDAAEVVCRSQAGVVCPPEDPAALADAVRRLRALSDAERNRMGSNGRVAVARDFGRETLVPRFEAILESVARPGIGAAGRE